MKFVSLFILFLLLGACGEKVDSLLSFNDEYSPEHIIFVTSIAYTGAFGGISGADATCQAQKYMANLPGDFRAIISDSGSNARSRFMEFAGILKNTRGEIIAYSMNDLWYQNFAAIGGIVYDESGNLITTNLNAWTGTLSDGSSAANNCNQWTDGSATPFSGAFGTIDMTDGTWINNSDSACSSPYRLYCTNHP